MRVRSPLHPIGCGCAACLPAAHPGHSGLVIKAMVRVLLLIAAIIAIPFLIARFWAAQGENR